jgi:hypothetical protein
MGKAWRPHLLFVIFVVICSVGSSGSSGSFVLWTVCIILVMASWIIDFRFYAEDCCIGMVILVYGFLCCDMPPPLLLIIYCLPSSIHLVLRGACVPSGLLDLVMLYAGMLALPPMLL